MASKNVGIFLLSFVTNGRSTQTNLQIIRTVVYLERRTFYYERTRAFLAKGMAGFLLVISSLLSM